MVEFLRKVLKGDIAIEDYNHSVKMPQSIDDEYKVEVLKWNEKECVLLTPKYSWNLHLIKNHMKTIWFHCKLPCVLCLSVTTPAIRKVLLDNTIPFMYPGEQIYFPFWDKYYMTYPVAITAKERRLFLSKKLQIHNTVINIR